MLAELLRHRLRFLYQNILLLNKITVDDFLYYKNMFPEKIIDTIFNREKTSVIFQTVDGKGSVRNGIARMKSINTIDLDEIEKRAKKILIKTKD